LWDVKPYSINQAGKTYIKHWNDTVKQDLKEISMSWEDAQECCDSREDGCVTLYPRHRMNQGLRIYNI